MIDKNNKYTKMQREHYDSNAAYWTEESRDHVVGSFDQHNNWADYEIRFERIENQKDKIGLDFGCGPGRNLVKYGTRFRRLDGVDISPINIQKAKGYTKSNGLNPILYVSDGTGIETPEDYYDFVMSTICLQHICVYDIRYSIFEGIYKTLKKGGLFTAQMGYGSPSPYTVGYYINHFEATGTNRDCDVCIENENQLKGDLEKIGFTDFEFKITQVGPGDCHPRWIFFSAKK